jgi:hypothetical protein
MRPRLSPPGVLDGWPGFPRLSPPQVRIPGFLGWRFGFAASLFVAGFVGVASRRFVSFPRASAIRRLALAFAVAL